MADTEPKQLSFRFPESGEQIEFKFDDPSTKSLGEAVGSLQRTLEEGLGLEGNKDSWLRKLLKQSKKKGKGGEGVGGGDEPQGPTSRSGAFFESLGGDLKDSIKGVVDSITAPIRGLPGVKSVGRAIGAARSFEPTQEEDSGVEGVKIGGLPKAEESNGILGEDGVGSIVDELKSGFSCMCRNTELIREQLDRMVDARRGDKLEAKEKANEEGLDLEGLAGALGKGGGGPGPGSGGFQWAKEIASGWIGHALGGVVAAIALKFGIRPAVHLLTKIPLVTKIPGLSTLDATLQAQRLAAQNAARIAAQGTHGVPTVTGAVPKLAQLRQAPVVIDAAAAAKARGPLARLITPAADSGLISRVLYGTPATKVGGFAGMGGTQVAGKSGLLKSIGLGGTKWLQAAQEASHAAQNVRSTLGIGAGLTNRAIRTSKLAQGGKLVRGAIRAKNLLKVSGVGTPLSVILEGVVWGLNNAQAEEGAMGLMNELSEINQDSYFGEGKIVDQATKTVFYDPNLDLGGISQEQKADNQRKFRSLQEMSANELKIQSLLDSALASRKEDQGWFGSDTGANQLLTAINKLMKDRETIASKSGFDDPVALQTLISFDDPDRLNKSISEIRDTFWATEFQDKGFISDVESSARDIEGGAASERAMEGPMGARARRKRSDEIHIAQISAADKAGGLVPLLENIQLETGKVISADTLQRFFQLRNDLSTQLKLSRDDAGVYEMLTQEQEDMLTDKALEGVGLQRPMGIPTINPTPGVIDQTIDSQNNLTNDLGAANRDGVGGSNAAIINGPNNTTNVVNNNTIHRNSSMNEIAFTRAASDSARANMFGFA